MVCVLLLLTMHSTDSLIEDKFCTISHYIISNGKFNVLDSGSVYFDHELLVFKTKLSYLFYCCCDHPASYTHVEK